MADPNISKHPIEAIRNSIELRLKSSRTTEDDIDPRTEAKLISKQDRRLSGVDELSKGMLGLLSAGYFMTFTILLLAGFQFLEFYLHTYVLIALIGSSVGTTGYMFRRITGLMFGAGD